LRGGFLKKIALLNFSNLKNIRTKNSAEEKILTAHDPGFRAANDA